MSGPTPFEAALAQVTAGAPASTLQATPLPEALGTLMGLVLASLTPSDEEGLEGPDEWTIDEADRIVVTVGTVLGSESTDAITVTGLASNGLASIFVDARLTPVEQLRAVLGELVRHCCGGIPPERRRRD